MTSGRSSAIVGRDAELASITAFVEGTGDGPTALVLEGEPGIGKSALWMAGVERARITGSRVLTARPAEAEASLAYAGLGDLLESALDEVLPGLSPPRRRALQLVMLREESPDLEVDPRALAVAVRDALAAICEMKPSVIAIDDLQWLDGPSAGVLAFAIRRLSGRPLRLLIAQRPGGHSGQRSLEDALGREAVVELAVGPLSVGAIHRLLLDRMGVAFARQTLLHIHRQSGGNPFYALELARVLDPEGIPSNPIHLPDTLEGLLRARLAGMPRDTIDALAIVSALGPTPTDLLARAGVGAGALDAAAAAQLIERSGEVVSFTHPLLPSLIYHQLGSRRREVHAQIARLVDEPIARARHLALSTEGTDGVVADAVEAAASAASRRGAVAAGAELYEAASRLTPEREDGRRRERRLAAARAYQDAGEWTRARSIARDLLSSVAHGRQRAALLMLLAELEGVDRAAELLMAALREPQGPAARSTIHCRLAWLERFGSGLRHARAAQELARSVNDPELESRARAVTTILRWFAGEPGDADELMSLVEHLPAALGGERLVQEATEAIANTLAPAATRPSARALFEAEYRDWRDRDEPRAARALWGLAWLGFWDGRWATAADQAARAHDISIQYGLEVPQDHLPIAVIAVHRGQLDLARVHSERALALSEDQFGFHPPQHLAVLALAALSSGDRDGALRGFERAQARAVALQWGEPSVRWWTGDHVELLLELGRIEDALQLLDGWRRDAVRVGRDWVLASVTRCSGLAAAAQGRVGDAIELLEAAVEEHEAVGDPFGRARALLALGIVRRRARQKRDARDAILAARDAFETIGASRWAARARAELGRIGGRTAVNELTAAERRVVELVAAGRTNREIAAALFLGERTVASHLTHVYAKLGVRSRTELANKVQTF